MGESVGYDVSRLKATRPALVYNGMIYKQIADQFVIRVWRMYVEFFYNSLSHRLLTTGEKVFYLAVS